MWNAQKVREHSLVQLVVVSIGVLLAAVSAHAQQTTGVPCSPSATTTADGRYLPNPPAPFGGVINLSAKDFQAVLARHCRSTQGCTEHLVDHDR